MIRIGLRRGAEKLPNRHHPWVFSGAIETVDTLNVKGGKGVKDCSQRGLCSVNSYTGEFIAYGWLECSLNIAIRLLSWDIQIIPDGVWWKRNIIESVHRRSRLLQDDRERTDSCRLIHGEADHLPGLVVDAYRDTVHIIISARVGYEYLDDTINAFKEHTAYRSILVSTDDSMRKHESLPTICELVHGETIDTVILEQGIAYHCDIEQGQKSGFYFDQRDNRSTIEAFAQGSDVLDAFCYSGGFTLHALRAGARSVVSMDSSEPALRLLERNVALNIESGLLDASVKERLALVRANVFESIRAIEQDRFSLMILDPPKLAPSRSQVEKAERAYKDLNRLAIERIRSGGIIATFTCSGNISRDHFRKIIAWAAHDAGRDVQILSTLGQPLDHPIRLSFPESEYLKGYIIRVL